MSPILVRPVREQLEHDRLIRLLHAKFRRKYEAGMNPGDEQNAPGRRRSLRPLSRPRPAWRPTAGIACRPSWRWRPANRSITSRRSSQWAHFGRLRARVPPLRAGEHGRRRAPALRGQPHPRRRNLELSPRRRRAALHGRLSQSRSAAGAAPQACRAPGGHGPSPPAKKPAPRPSKPESLQAGEVESLRSLRNPQSRQAGETGRRRSKGKKKAVAG